MMRALLSIVFFLVLAAAESRAAELRLALVDTSRLLNGSKEAQAKRKELDQKSADAKKSLDEKGKALQALEQKLKSSAVAETSKEAEDFRAKTREFNRLVKDIEDDLRADFMRSNKAIAEKAVKLIADYAKANKIDLVLDSSEKAKSVVLYGESALDITEDLLKQMNK